MWLLELKNFTQMRYLLICYIFLGALGTLQAQQAMERPKVLQKHQELTSYRLSDAQTQAYQKRAKQKLGDLADYVQFIINARHPSEQKLALRQLHKLFWEVPAWARSVESIRGYMGKAKKVKLTSVKIAEPLSITKEVYQGKLVYHWSKQPKTLTFTVRKIIKKIGSRRVKVWKLFF